MIREESLDDRFVLLGLARTGGVDNTAAVTDDAGDLAEHFELRRGTRPVDPALFLVPREESPREESLSERLAESTR